MASKDDLPDKNAPELRLVRATPEELAAQQNVNFTEWGGVLSLPAYLRREELLASQTLTRDGGQTAWMLVHQPNGASTRRVLCGAETIRKRALVASSDGRIRDVVTHGVGSVFCPTAYRGRGYAGRMMHELGTVLKTWQADSEIPCLFSVLYSDIGKTFYAARGWMPFPSAHVSLPAAATNPTEVKSLVLPPVRELAASDLPDLCAQDEKLLRGRLAAHARRPAVAIVPDHGTMAWHHAREEFIAKELFGRDPEVKGAMVDGEPGARAWCYWTRVWTNPQEEAGHTLHILRLVVEDDEVEDEFEPAPATASAATGPSPRASRAVAAIAALWAAARREAARWDMPEVQLWNPSARALTAARSLVPTACVEQREKESIASLLWYGEGEPGEVEWVCNEKFGWN